MDIDESVGGLALRRRSHRDGLWATWWKGTEFLGVPATAAQAQAWRRDGAVPVAGTVEPGDGADNPEGDWLRSDYHPGDALIFAGETLHAARAQPLRGAPPVGRRPLPAGRLPAALGSQAADRPHAGVLRRDPVIALNELQAASRPLRARMGGDARRRPRPGPRRARAGRADTGRVAQSLSDCGAAEASCGARSHSDFGAELRRWRVRTAGPAPWRLARIDRPAAHAQRRRILRFRR